MAQSLDHNKCSLIWAIITLAERGLHKWMKITKLPFLDREQGFIGDDHKYSAEKNSGPNLGNLNSNTWSQIICYLTS